MRSLLVVFASALAAALVIPGPVEAQCDSCGDADWGAICLHDDPDGEMSGCHQHEPDHCDFTGSCESGLSLNATSIGGSLAISRYALAPLPMLAGVTRRSCDGAVTSRLVSAKHVGDTIDRVSSLRL